MAILGLSGVGVGSGNGVGSGIGLKPRSGSSKIGGAGCTCGVAFWSLLLGVGLLSTFGLGGMRITGDFAATFLGGGVTGLGDKGIVLGAVATIGGVMG